MEKLYNWNAKRAGGRITVTHSCGKIANIDTIQPEKLQPGGVRVVATCADGRKFELAF